MRRNETWDPKTLETIRRRVEITHVVRHWYWVTPKRVVDVVPPVRQRDRYGNSYIQVSLMDRSHAQSVMHYLEKSVIRHVGRLAAKEGLDPCDITPDLARNLLLGQGFPVSRRANAAKLTAKRHRTAKRFFGTRGDKR